MPGLNSYEGNSIIAMHEQDERNREIRESDEAGQSAECIACGERTLERVRYCKATGTPSTTYCIGKGGNGCLYKRTGRCAGHILKTICSRCGEEN